MSLTRAVILAALPRTAWEEPESPWGAITDLLASSACGSSTWVARARRWYASEPGVDRVADGLPFQVEHLTALGNAVVPFIAAYLGNA